MKSSMLHERRRCGQIITLDGRDDGNYGIQAVLPHPEFTAAYWDCYNGFTFDLTAGINQTYNGTPANYPYATHVVPNVTNLTINFGVTFKTAGLDTIDGSEALCGIGIGNFSAGVECESPGVDSYPTYGGWNYLSRFQTNNHFFIGYSTSVIYGSGNVITPNVSHFYNVTITVGPNKGGDLFDVTVRVVCAEYSIDHSETIINGISSLAAMIKIAGQYRNGSGDAAAESMHISQLTIVAPGM